MIPTRRQFFTVAALMASLAATSVSAQPIFQSTLHADGNSVRFHVAIAPGPSPRTEGSTLLDLPAPAADVQMEPPPPGITVRPVQVGRRHALWVTVAPRAAAAPIELAGTVSLAPEAKSAVTTLPAPPAPWRVPLPRDGGLVAVAAAEGASPAVLHAGRLLPAAPIPAGRAVYIQPAPADVAAHSAFLDPAAAVPSPPMAIVDANPGPIAVPFPVSLERRMVLRPARVHVPDANLPPGHRIAAWAILAEPANTLRIELTEPRTSDRIDIAATVLGGGRVEQELPLVGTITVNGTVLDSPPLQSGLTAVHAGTLLSTNRGPLELNLVHESTLENEDWQALLSVEVTWTAAPLLDATSQTAVDLDPDDAGSIVTIGGWPAAATADDLLLVDVTDAAAPRRLTGAYLFDAADGLRHAAIRVPEGTRRLLAARPDALPAPTPLAAESLPDAAALTAPLDTIVVAHAAAAAEVARLATLRPAGSMLHLDPQAAANVYTAGIVTPAAIRSAVAALLAAAPTAPLPRVLLVGEPSLDVANRLAGHADLHLPAMIELDVENGEYVTDAPYAAVLGEDPLPDVAVGRLPAPTTESLRAIVDRLLAEAALAASHRGARRAGVFAAEDTDPQFAADAAAWQAMWRVDDRRLDVALTVGDPATPAREALETLLSRRPGGASLVVYTGSGNAARLGRGSWLDLFDMHTLPTADAWPILVATGPPIAATGVPDQVSLGEQALIAPSTSGLLAVVAPSGADFYGDQSLLTTYVIEVLAAAPTPAIGDVVHEARLAFLLDFPSLAPTAARLQLLGDPGTVVQQTGTRAGNLFLIH